MSNKSINIKGSSKGATFYVVKRGHTTGIFNNWKECKAAVEGYTSPIFKKFETQEEALTFFKSEIIELKYKTTDKPFTTNNVKDHSKESILKKSIIKESTPQESGSKSMISESDMVKIKAMSSNIKSSQYSEELNYNVSGWNVIDNDIYIFTDGSSRKSKDYFNSGIGVYIGFQCTNIKEQYNNKTNNQCELMAIDYAFKLIVRYFREIISIGKLIKIVSDSEYSIKACTVWLIAWKANNWKTSKGEDVKNKDLIESIDGSMTRIKIINSKLDADKKIKVKFIHVNSHQPPDMNDKLKFSVWFGNYIADGLAQNKM